MPRSIEKRLNSLASTDEDFKAAVPDYQRALDASGHKYTLKRTTPNQTPRNPTRRRRRNVIWFNPPYNASVKTSVGKKFLELIDKHFPRDNELCCILNRNTVKVSYSCTKNVRQILSTHNRKLLQQPATLPGNSTEDEKKCDCRDKDQCPMAKNCQQAGIYKATLPNGKFYIGSSVNFKSRYGVHKHSFKYNKKETATALSTYVWEQRNDPDNPWDPVPSIKWEMLDHPTPYQKGGRLCDLCLTEKLYIAKGFSNPNQLNKRTDIALKCKHRKKHRLKEMGN